MRFFGNVFLPPLPSNLNNLNLFWMCHNYSSCHCTGCFFLYHPAACESCSVGWPVPRHPLNIWMNASSTGDLCFLVLYSSDLFQVRVVVLYAKLHIFIR